MNSVKDSRPSGFDGVKFMNPKANEAKIVFLGDTSSLLLTRHRQDFSHECYHGQPLL